MNSTVFIMLGVIKMSKQDVSLEAMFIGPKSENKELFKSNLLRMFDDHVEWRKNYHPEDGKVITLKDKESSEYKESVERLENTLDELSSRLRSKMMPWHSPRYIGHMCSETLMPSLLGYFAATLYNGNNVAYEAGPATSDLEAEVGDDMCRLMGYKIGESWGHIAADGSIANYEALWYARNIKSIPLAIKEVIPEEVEGRSEWELLNMSIPEMLDILDRHTDKMDEIKAHSIRSKHDKMGKLGKIIVPQTKHYSWVKATDLIGVGSDNIISIPVDNNYRMNTDILKAEIDKLVEQHIPIMAVISVVGTTEEGAIDRVHKVIEMKKEYSKKGINFYYHIDAAYGGYGRAIFLDENFNFIPKDKLHDEFIKHGVFKNPDFNWPNDEVYEGFKALSEADSITMDPHKMGYVPYQAGGIVIKDKRMRNIVSYYASYVFPKTNAAPELLGAFILAGSKPGAAAAAVWAAHRTLPLNITGYGKLLGASIEGSHNLYRKIKEVKEYKVRDKIIELHTLTEPDFNMVDFIVNFKGNKNLDVLNKLTEEFYNKKVRASEEPYKSDLMISHTEFNHADYGDAPKDLVLRCGMSESEWERVHNVVVLRSCVLSPFLNRPEVFEYYSKEMDKSMVKLLGEVIKDIEF